MVWSVGMIVMELLQGAPDLANMHPWKAAPLLLRTNGEHMPLLDTDTFASHEAKDFLTSKCNTHMLAGNINISNMIPCCQNVSCMMHQSARLSQHCYRYDTDSYAYMHVHALFDCM